MPDSIHGFVQDTLDTAQRVWDGLADPNSLGNLHDVPSKVSATVHFLWDKITLQGTLGTPNPRDWLPDQFNPPAPPPPPPPTTTRTPAWLNSLASHAGQHPLAYSLAAVGLTTTASYAVFPRQTLRAAEPLTRLVPLALLPEPKNRPLRLLPATHGVAAEVRKEAVVVLGADGPVGRELALELERRGFVVIATVREPGEVDALERNSRGWLKALVLDPNDSFTVSAFLRSLSTALSLRFPLHTSGDPFSRPAQALALTGVVNCLSLTAAPEALAPLEAAENDVVRRLVGERVATVVGVVKGLLPILRQAAGRPGAPTGSFISLVPSSSSNLSLPFLASTSAADAALSSLFHSLRRELSASSTSAQVQLTILETGLISSPASPSLPPPVRAPLPIRLEYVYAPALARRMPVQDTGAARTKCKTRKGTEVRRLTKRVVKMLLRPGNTSAVERFGAGSTTYLLVSLLPHSLIDLCLTVHDRLYGLYLSHLAARFSALSSRLPSSRSPASPTRSARPLPTPPAGHPESLRPAHATGQPQQVPVADPFVPVPSPSTASFASGSGDEHETGSQSSLEDFGPLGASTASVGMGGSFVEVGRGEGAEGQ
ncbi:hypothetical protein JCM8097_003599 [Rhodosporidiobolus ruineniae]